MQFRVSKLMEKKKDTSLGSANAYDLRRSDIETQSRKQATSSLVDPRKAKRIEKHTLPSRSPVRFKLEKKVGSGFLRRSDGGKKMVAVRDLPNIMSTNEKAANSSKQSSEDVGGRKRKTVDAIQFKALFKAKRTRTASGVEGTPPQANTSRNKDVGKELQIKNSVRVQEAPVKGREAFSEGRVFDLDQIEHGDRRQTKSLDDESIKSDNHTLHTSSYRHENDLQNQQELDTCHKGEEAFEKAKRERDEQRASLENEYIIDKSFIYVLYRNPSIRSEKLNIIERKFAKRLEEHKRLWEIRLEELKATMPAAVGHVAAENAFSLHGSQHETRVVPSRNPEVAYALPENPIEAQSHDEPVCEEMCAATEQIGEVPAQQLDDDIEVDVVEKDDSNHDNSKESTSGSDVSHAVEDHDKTGANDMAPHVDSGGMEMPVGNYHKGNDEDGTVRLDASHVLEDRPEMVNNVAPEVEFAEIGTEAGTCDKKNAEDVDTFPHTPDVGDDHNETGPDDVLPHVESAEMAIPVEKVNAEGSIIRPDALHTNIDHNDSGGFYSDNPVSAAISLDKTPSAQPVPSPASEYEIQNKSLQLEQLPDNEVQDDEIRIGNLQPSAASQLDQIIPDDEPDFPSSTDPMVAENPSDTLPPSGQLIEPTCEEPVLTVPESGENLEENLVTAAAATPHEERQPHLATSVAPTPPVNALNMFDNIPSQVSPQMSNQTHPLQAEVERLYTVKDNVTKLYQEMCEDLTPGHPVSRAELTQQLPRVSVSPSVRIFHGQSSGNQKPPQPPLPQPQPQLRPQRPPLQIVHQPAALFSTTPSRLRPPPALLH
ncbi:hypothetical protein M8C21_027228 [Ambrosia artemisiifolia]|uniref:Uncharacterized protein n=1 Tax=Ambrosia artemisiifolia TaxID=4212 RepID=A0AAD5G811_AMBAR|nr:hypothetical protein M8C21_027228 [Ambrosia artemisiifolia]